VARLREYGAVVHRHGREYAEALAAAGERAAATGALTVHAYDQPEVVAGQGTVGLELPEADAVLVAVGGGGLMGGVAAAVGDRMRIVAVEPVGAPTLNAALAAGAPVDVAVDSVAGDSLGARRAGGIGFALAVRHAVQSLLVSDEEIVQARRELWHEHRLLVEHGAAAAYAGLKHVSYDSAVVILCGANTDAAG
jgi:threonine dehydratase